MNIARMSAIVATMITEDDTEVQEGKQCFFAHAT
jgi:hypothetical protein